MRKDFTNEPLDAGGLREPVAADALELLVPWELSTHYTLDDDERRELLGALAALTEALNSGCDEPERILEITQSLRRPVTSLHQPRDTRSPLSGREVLEYDRYFSIRHVDSNDAALSLVRSLLSSCHAFAELNRGASDLDPEEVEDQRLGYLTFARMLRRALVPASDR